MARTIDANRRAELMHAAATHLVEHGLAGVSLSDIASTANTSSRMLVHHFGTRDALVAGALEIARHRQLELARRRFTPGPDAVAVLNSSWRWFVSADSRKYFRLFQQAAALERLEPGDDVGSISPRLGSDWRPMLAQVFQADRRFRHDAATHANLAVAVYRGLALELTSEPDLRRMRATFTRFTAILAGAGESREPSASHANPVPGRTRARRAESPR